MNRGLVVSKAKAFGIHFAISLGIFLILLYFVVFHWYPSPFFSTDGGWQGIRLIVLIDLVLGPTLTLIVFNPSKPTAELKLDLSIIAVCQAVALIWGAWAVHNERPYLAVFSEGNFHPLPYYQIQETGLEKKDLDKFGHVPPLKIYTETPTDPKEYFALIKRLFTTGQPPHFSGELYRSLNSEHIQDISRYKIDMEYYLSDQPENLKIYREYIQANPTHKEMLYLALVARFGKFIIIFDPTKLNFVDVLDIPPPDIDEIVWGKEEAKRRRREQSKKMLEKRENK